VVLASTRTLAVNATSASLAMLVILMTVSCTTTKTTYLYLKSLLFALLYRFLFKVKRIFLFENKKLNSPSLFLAFNPFF